MEKTKSKLMVMSETDEGINFSNLTPFFIHDHVYDMLEKAETALLIYKELKKISTFENTIEIIEIIKKSNTPNEAKQKLMVRFSISEPTALDILDTPLEDIDLFGACDYEDSISIYEEAVLALSSIAKKQRAMDALEK